MKRKDSAIQPLRTLGETQSDQLAKLSSAGHLRFPCGPFTVALHTSDQRLLSTLQKHYAPLPLLTPSTFCSFHIAIQRAGGLRRWIKPQLLFGIDGLTPFEPYPATQGMPLFEWGLNWCIATTTFNYLMLHSGAIERDGQAMLLPALPGSGKTTLSAALMLSGWRLLSDEFGIVDLDNGSLHPMPRVLPLKNRSIDVIQAHFANAELGPRYLKTRKGTVAHLSPSTESLLRTDERALPTKIVFPRYQEGVKTNITDLSKSEAFIRLSNNSFNYHLLRERGFKRMCALIETCDCYALTFSDLEVAVDLLNSLVREPA